MPSIEAEIRQFFKEEIDELEGVAGRVIRSAGSAHVARQKADAAKAFRNTFHPASKSWPKAFRAYHLRPQGDLGFASYSRAAAHMWIYEEGAVISGTPFLGVRTLDGEKLKLPRIGKRSTRKLDYRQLLEFLFTRFGKKNVGPATSKAGNPLLRVRVAGNWLVVYTFLRHVKMPSVLKFYSSAEAIGREIPGKIARLVNA